MSEPMTPPDPASYNPLVDPEALLVSAMMWSNDEETLQEIAEFLTPEDFYRVQYSVVFSAICWGRRRKRNISYAKDAWRGASA